MFWTRSFWTGLFGTARRRLVAWNVLVMTFFLALLSVAIYWMFAAQLLNQVDNELRAQQQRDEYNIVRGGSLYSALPASSTYTDIRTVISSPQGNPILSSDCPILIAFSTCPRSYYAPVSVNGIQQVLKTGGDDVRTESVGQHPERSLTFLVSQVGEPVAIIQLSRGIAGEETSLHQLTLLLIGSVLVGFVLAAFGSIFLANRALVPIRQAFRRQRQFTADASHELRTPLALIRANAEMLERHGDRIPDGDGELVTEIIRETDHLNRLVGDLLTLARADADTAQLHTRTVDFRSLVSGVHEDLQLIAESRGIKSGIVLNGPVLVEGDETRLRQLLLILLDNALKYTDPGGHVDLALLREDGHVQLVVSDTGVGIPSRDLPRIFDRFYRVDRAREHESGGTGLGLAIAKWIVQAHHGTIKVESDLGKGTRFQIDLPALPTHNRSSASS